MRISRCTKQTLTNQSISTTASTTSATPASATASRNLLPAGAILSRRVRGVWAELQSVRAGLMTKQKRGFWKSPQKNITEKKEKKKKEQKPKMKNKIENPLTKIKGFFLICIALYL